MRRRPRLLRAYFAGRPVWCSWQVTRRCDALCLFCEHRAEGGDGELDTAAFTTAVGRLGAAGSMIVSLTGGEPFLRDDLPELVAATARWHFPMLTTHGWLVDRARARAVWSAGLVAASVRLDDADAASHDEAAGLRGAHARAIAAIEALAGERVRKDQRVNVKTRLRGSDLGPLSRVASLAAERGATVTVEPEFPVARGLSESLGRELLGLKRRHPNLRTSAWFLGRVDEARGRGVSSCRAGRAFLNVDHRGRVSKCIEFQGPADRAGDLAREDAGPVLERLRASVEGNTCRACWSAARGGVEALYTPSGLAAGLAALVGR